MEIFKMNKNVDHNGAKYAKGQQIKKGDEGFEVLVEKGHADKIVIEQPEADAGKKPAKAEKSKE